MNSPYSVSLDQIDELNDILSSAAGIIRVSALAAARQSDEIPRCAPLDATLHAAKLIDEALAIVNGLNTPTRSAEVQA